MGKNNEDDKAESLQIEKQKTLRLMMKLGCIAILGLCAMFILFRGTSDGGSGKVDIDLTSGKLSLSLEKPIVEQVGLNKSSAAAGGNTIQFTEGKISNPETIQALKALAPNQPTQFSGQNFINYEAGFLLSVQHPSRWQITHNPAGMYNSNVPVNTIYNQDGSHLNIGVAANPSGMDIQQFVTFSVQSMLQSGMIQQMPEVTYDYGSQTAFAIITNPMTMGQSYQKIIVDDEKGRVYIASANYNQMLSSPGTIQELTDMIATFTVIEG